MRLVTLLIMSMLLSACGWQLQGARRVPERLLPLYLDLKDEHSPFARILANRLSIAGIAVTSDQALAQTTLRVTRDLSGHHVSSVSALNEPQQYEVYYNIDYQLDAHTSVARARDAQKPTVADVGSTNLLPSQTVAISRTMSYDKTLALAKQREELMLKDTLAEEIVNQVLRRLSMLPTATSADTPTTP